NRIREVRGGELSSSEFGTRMKGKGTIADSIHQLYSRSVNRHFPGRVHPPLSTNHFRRPGQLDLF
ncbi:MAG: radical SAM protein, partial [Bacteroidota bacterium]